MATYQTQANEPIRPARQVPVAMAELGKTLEVLEKNVATLEEQLASVMEPTPPSPGQVAPQDRPPMCPMAAQLDAMRSGVERLAARLQRIREDVEI